MSEEFAVSPFDESLSWGETWIKALTRPSVETYEEIASDPNAGPRRAFTWMVVSSLIGYTLFILVTSLVGTGLLANQESLRTSVLEVYVCGVLIFGFIGAFALAIAAGISQLIASLLGGTGTYAQLVYAFAAYMAPLSLISYFLAGIPWVICLTLPLGFYGVILNVTAIKAVHKFSWGRAVVSSFTILASILGLIALVAVVILVLLAPAVDTVFTDILREFGTPVP